MEGEVLVTRQVLSAQVKEGDIKQQHGTFSILAAMLILRFVVLLLMVGVVLMLLVLC